MLEILERKVIGVGEDKRVKHVVIPKKWERLHDIQAGEKVKIILTDSAVVVFKNDGSGEKYFKALERIQKEKEESKNG